MTTRGMAIPGGSRPDAGVPGAAGRRPLALLGFLALVVIVAAIGSAITLPAVGDGGWYGEIVKPAWTPPERAFGPVWTVLYALMAVSAWLVWREAGPRWGCAALELWGAQLALNLFWTVLFFGLGWFWVAAVELLVLSAAILACMRAFEEWSRPAALLLLPCLIWTAFAAALNVSIAWLN